jgi:hypothetical protein
MKTHGFIIKKIVKLKFKAQLVGYCIILYAKDWGSNSNIPLIYFKDKISNHYTLLNKKILKFKGAFVFDAKNIKVILW